MDIRKVRRNILVWIMIFCFVFAPQKTWGEITENQEKVQQDLVEAPGAVLMEKETGTVIYSKDPDTRRSPASITKIMTLILIFDAIQSGKLHLEDTITTSAYAKSMGGSQVYLEEGEKQSVETMIKCIVIASGNDASVAMAEHICGSETEFVKRMNARAKSLGMEHTNFEDCCGLTDSDNHYTTAYDVALMSKELITKYPKILDYSSVWMETITHHTNRGDSECGLTNTNKLIRGYDGCVGLKTGSTSKAKYCVSAVAKRNGLTLISVIMTAPDYKARFQDGATLLNLGFATCSLYEDKSTVKKKVPVKKSVQREGICENKKKFSYLDTEGKSLSKIEKKIQLKESVEAPVTKGMKAGEIQYYLENEKIGSIDLVFSQNIKKARYVDYLKMVLEKFFRNRD